MSMVEGANSGDVEEGSSLAVSVSACGNALAVLAQLCPTAWKSQSETSPRKITFLPSCKCGTGMKHPGLETGHHSIVVCIHCTD